MSKDLILRDIYKANLKKGSSEPQPVRPARKSQRKRNSQKVTAKKRSLALLFSLLLLSFVDLNFNTIAKEWIITELSRMTAGIDDIQQIPKNPITINSLSARYSSHFDYLETTALQPPIPPLQSVSPLNSLSFLAKTQEQQTSIAELMGLGVKTIVIDPGHGGRDPGAIGPSGLMEKQVTLDLAQKLKKRLLQYQQYRVLLTHEADNTMSLRERVEFANENQADLFISIHINSLPVRHTTVIETYYFGDQSDETAKLAAQRENQSSGYSMSEFREMIAKIGDSLKLQESKKLAASIQDNLYNNLKQQQDSIDNWGIKTAPFVVLLGVEMPSVLAEVTTLSSVTEEEQLKTELYREKIASYLELGITNYLNRINLNRNRLIGRN